MADYDKEEMPKKKPYQENNGNTWGFSPLEEEDRTGDIHSHPSRAAPDSKAMQLEKPRKEALENFVILSQILSHLGRKDLGSCCEVSIFWKSIADPLMPRIYDVSLMKAISPDDHDSHKLNEITKSEYVIIVDKTPEANRRDLSWSEGDTQYSFENATKFLTDVLVREKIQIRMKVIQNYTQDDSDELKTFLKKFGPFVISCNPWAEMSSVKFYQRLIHELPNLQLLDLTSAVLLSSALKDQANFNPNLPTNQLKSLNRIDLAACNGLTVPIIRPLFQMAPNLRHIYDYPLLLVEAVMGTGKANCVRSIEYPDNEDEIGLEETFGTALEKWGGLGPKLYSFSFDPSDYHGLEDYLYGPQTQPFVLQILNSSHSSLKSLTIYQSESLDWNSTGPMPNLEKLKLIHCPALANARFFPGEISLERQFPNVRVLSITTKIINSFIPGTYPENQFIPWGSKIKELQIQLVTSKIVEQLERIFPNVVELSCTIGAFSVNFASALAAVAEKWPQLQGLTVEVSQRQRSSVEGGRDWTLESVLTGIDDDILRSLKDPLLRAKLAPELHELTRHCSLRKLSDLKLLTFIGETSQEDRYLIEKLVGLSEVAKEFCFQHLPQLKILLQASLFYEKVFSDLKAAVTQWVEFEVQGEPVEEEPVE